MRRRPQILDVLRRNEQVLREMFATNLVEAD